MIQETAIKKQNRRCKEVSFANTLNYPGIIDTEQKLNIFFDYTIHSWLECYHYEQYCKFRGVRTENDYYRRKVIVNVPLYTVPEKQMELSKQLKYDIDQVLMRFSASLAVGCNVEVHLLINCKDDTISSTNKVEREVNKIMFIPEVEKIIHRTSKRGEFFTVVWKDNTTTTVKLMEGDDSDDYTAFLYAVGKKMFENKGVARKYIAEKKAVFENEMEQKSIQKARVRRQQAIQQSLDAEDFPDVSDLVYGEMFVAPALISKTMFRKNKR